MIQIQKNLPKNIKINTQYLKDAVQMTLDHLNQSEMDITLRLTTDAEMRHLNQTFRGIAEPTDVLSFNQDTIDPETKRLYLGDIIISIDRALEQANEQDHSVDRETALLAIHGTLHLLGYDHAVPEDQREMWALQKSIFDRLIHETEGEDQ
jgi:probable rRNA maturation factor